MSDHEYASYTSPDWHPGAVRSAVIAAAKKFVSYSIAAPPLTFYEALADRAEAMTNEAISEAISARADDQATIASNLGTARRLLNEIGDNLFLATEQADDPTLARLAAHLVVEGNDGYNYVIYSDAWGAHRDPEWGAIWGVHQEIRDFTPAFLFKVCMRGDVRFLAVECHAPTRRLPGEPHARLRARTLILSGVPVLAFSPVEVEGDPAECTSEIASALATLAQELLALHDLDTSPRLDFRPRG
jgi:hypothetical protein